MLHKDFRPKNSPDSRLSIEAPWGELAMLLSPEQMLPYLALKHQVAKPLDGDPKHDQEPYVNAPEVVVVFGCQGLGFMNLRL